MKLPKAIILNEDGTFELGVPVAKFLVTPEPTPVQAFADKHDICDFGRELLLKRAHVHTLEDAWTAGEVLCCVFMYVKGVRGGKPKVFTDFASRLRDELFKDGFFDAAAELKTHIDKFSVVMNAFIENQKFMNSKVREGKRLESAHAALPQLAVGMARNIALFALDFASQARYGKFDLKFSFRMADEFRKIVGDNPFTGK